MGTVIQNISLVRFLDMGNTVVLLVEVVQLLGGDVYIMGVLHI